MPAVKKATANEKGYYGRAIVSDKVRIMEMIHLL